MTDLEALIVIFRGLPVDPSLLVLQSIAEVFLSVEPFVFDLPTQAPGGAELDDGGGGDRKGGQVNEASDGLLTALKVSDRLEALEPLEPMAVIVYIGDPAQVLFGPLLPLEAPLTAVLVRAERLLENPLRRAVGPRDGSSRSGSWPHCSAYGLHNLSYGGGNLTAKKKCVPPPTGVLLNETPAGRSRRLPRRFYK